MSCMTVSIHVWCGRPLGLVWPSVQTMTSLDLRATCPSDLTLCRLRWLAMLAWLVVASSSALEGSLVNLNNNPRVPG